MKNTLKKNTLKKNTNYDIDGFSKNISGYNPLLIATAEGHLEAVKYLLDNGAEPNINAMNLGQSLLHFAAYYGFYDILRLLIDYGADVNIFDKYGRTPLFLSIEAGYDSISKYLIENGTNLLIRDIEYQTVIDMCKKYKNGNLLKVIRKKLGKQ